MVKLKQESDVRILRVSGKILGTVLYDLEREAKPGVSLLSLDKRARALIERYGAVPAFLGYRPFGRRPYPASVCTSVNDQIVHGIPSRYVLKNGDVLKIDLGVNYRNYFTDAAITVAVGTVGKEVNRLIETTRTALSRAIAQCRKEKRLGDIGAVIENTAKEGRCTVVEGLTGHGVGFALHEDPSVYNYGREGEGMELLPGLVLAIEPMFSMGGAEVRELENGSFVTADGSLAAHFEHTVLVTESAPEVLTAFPG